MKSLYIFFFSSSTIYFWEFAKLALDMYFCLKHKVRLKGGLEEGRLPVKFTFRLERDLLGG